jgi:NAD(P)-dependent dehydrogenase (short-subunit alcohol dehydrogenase family)
MARQLFDLTDRTYAITGGGGVLCGELALALAGCGANVVILDRDLDRAEKVVQALAATRGRHRAQAVDVLDRSAIDAVAASIADDYGKVDGLVNGAGGNHPEATTEATRPFFDLPAEALMHVTNLNLLGTVLACQAFCRRMAECKSGVVLNISSMNAFRPLTRIPAYSAAKAAVSNFTQWLAVHLAQEYSPEIRVNAIAPGFFLTDQNRFLLTDRETGKPTPRAEQILAHTPLGRFGTPADLNGAALWLLSPASAFVTGVVVPIDGGFSAFSGV